MIKLRRCSKRLLRHSIYVAEIRRSRLGQLIRAAIFWRGIWNRRSSCCTSSRASQRRTHGRRVSTDEECLGVSWFQHRFDARREIAAWRMECNGVRPHSSLEYLTPHEHAAQRATANYGKDACQTTASFENAKKRGCNFPTAPSAADGTKALYYLVNGNRGQVNLATQANPPQSVRPTARKTSPHQ